MHSVDINLKVTLWHESGAVLAGHVFFISLVGWERRLYLSGIKLRG